MKDLLQWERGSASQVKTYRECKRKWWWEKVYGLSSDGSAATRLGSLIHDYIEKVLKGEEEIDNESFPSNRVAKVWEVLAKYRPIPAANVEKGFLEYDLFTVPIKGMIDVLHVEERDGELYVTVLDHKSTKSPNFRWALTPEQLIADAQGQIYPAVARHELRQVYGDTIPMHISFVHNYICTAVTKEPKLVVAHLTDAVMDEGIASVNATLSSMLEDSKKKEAKDVLPTLSACGNYGGCPWASRCLRDAGTSVVDMVWSNLEGDDMSMDWLLETKTEQTVKTEEKEKIDGGIICVNCRPRKGTYITLEEWTAQEQEAWAKGAKLPHYMADPYNKGPRSVCVLVDNKVRSGAKPLPPTLVIDTRTALGGTFIGFLDPTVYHVVIDGRF